MKSNILATLILSVLLLLACKQSENSVTSSLLSKEKISGITDLHTSTRGSGDPVIVIHGGPGLSTSYMEHLLDDIANDHQLIFYDQRNSGRSELDNDSSKMSLAGFLEDIDDVRKAYGHEKVHIMAHSWGGLLGMQYAPVSYTHLTLPTILLV